MDYGSKKNLDVLKENSWDKPLQVLDFVRYKAEKEFRKDRII